VAGNSFVALGDSFTEGLDDWRPDGTPRGWADRVAERLRPDLIAFCAGGNDIIRFTCDTDDLARRFDAALERVTATGAQVFVFTGFDLGRMHPLIRRLRGRVACYNELMRASAERHGSTVVDLWGMAPLADPRTWGKDRLHLTAEGHRRVALRVLETLGEPVAEDWRAPLPAADPAPWRHRQREDLVWMRNFVMPYVRGRLRGRRTGDGFTPKRPELLPLDLDGRQPAL
jgi:lysophospholipase L1-like esterase